MSPELWSPRWLLVLPPAAAAERTRQFSAALESHVGRAAAAGAERRDSVNRPAFFLYWPIGRSVGRSEDSVDMRVLALTRGMGAPPGQN